MKIATKFEIKVAEMLVGYCFGSTPTKSDLDKFLFDLGFAPYDNTASDKILSITRSIIGNEKETTRRR